MPGTTSEGCVCREQDLPHLVDSWRSRLQPVLVQGVNAGRPVNQPALQRSLTLLDGILKDEPSSFDPRYRDLSHHLPECPFASEEGRAALALLH